MTKNNVAVILVTWNGIKDTLECVASLKNARILEKEIILVDNNSQDDTVATIRKEYPDITIIENSINGGFAPAVNIGIRKAIEMHFEYILLLNNDTIVDKNFLKPLHLVLKNIFKVGIACSKIYYADPPEKIWFAGGKTDFSSGYFHNIQTDIAQNSIRDVDFVSGCCMLFRTNLISEIGYFNNIYESYVEDIEFNLKARDKGYLVALVEESKIWHKVSSSSGGDGSPKKTFLKVRNTIFFSRSYLKRKFGLISYYYLTRYLIFQILLNIRLRRLSSVIAIIDAIPIGLFHPL